MGTHPIFESDFDCLTDRAKMSGFNNGNFGDSKRVKTDIPEEEQPSLIINQVLELAQATTQKNPQELQNAFDSIKKRLKGLRDDIQSSPALKSLKETQELECAVLEEQLQMKSALIERYKNQNIHTNLAKIEMISNNIMN